jgi:hypothetical protein
VVPLLVPLPPWVPLLLPFWLAWLEACRLLLLLPLLRP